LARKIAVSTNKGGVLKSSLSVNISGALSENNKVLIIDADNQGDVALSFGMNPDEFQYSFYDVLVDDLAYEYVIHEAAPNIHILPSNDDMEFLEFDVLTNLKQFKNPFHLMRSKLRGIEKHYDYILIDTPPNLGLTHGNVLCFADEVLIPFQPESYSMRSLVKILRSIEQFQEKHNPDLKVLGVIGTLVDTRTVLHSQILQECRRFCLENNIRMFDTVIPKSIRFASAIAYDGMPATLSDKKNSLVKSYYDLKGEIFDG